jgi:hypothetical protein
LQDLTVRLRGTEWLVGTYFGLYYLSLAIGARPETCSSGISFDVAESSGLPVVLGVLLATHRPGIGDSRDAARPPPAGASRAQPVA